MTHVPDAPHRLVRHLAPCVAALALVIANASLHEQSGFAGDSAAVIATAARFHAALAAGDSSAAMSLLDAGVRILESGGIEDRAHYREHHLPADIAFARAATSTRTVKEVAVRGDVAWLVATSTTTGESNGRPINSQGAELMVLARVATGWTITAVHWSSRRRE